MKQRMNPKTEPEPAAQVVDLFHKIGRDLGLTLYRVILYADNRGEAEFQARNPVECLAIKWETATQLKEILAKGDVAQELVRHAFFRKKCTRCFLHEREASPSEI